MSKQYIYTIAGLTKKHGQREVLKDIWLAFYPGAKIGVLGRNGSGKSTLLRIMAGLDTEFDGEARLTDGFTRGFLPQEPVLNPDKDVWGNVEEAVARRRAMLDRYNEISAQLAEPLDDRQMQKLCDEMARLQDQIDATQHLGAGSRDRDRLRRDEPAAARRRRAARCPAASGGAWRCASCCCSGPTCCCWTSRRTTWTPRPWPGWNGTCRSIPARWWP